MFISTDPGSVLTSQDSNFIIGAEKPTDQIWERPGMNSSCRWGSVYWRYYDPNARRRSTDSYLNGIRSRNLCSYLIGMLCNQWSNLNFSYIMLFNLTVHTMTVSLNDAVIWRSPRFRDHYNIILCSGYKSSPHLLSELHALAHLSFFRSSQERKISGYT